MVTFWFYPPYFQPKSKYVLNDSEWLETHFKHVFEKCNEDWSFDPPPSLTEVNNVNLKVLLKVRSRSNRDENGDLSYTLKIGLYHQAPSTNHTNF